MITDKLDQIFSSVFFRRLGSESVTEEMESILRLPLERTASEQTKYAQWLYGGRMDEILNEIREMEYSEDQEQHIKFDYKSNTFTFDKPKSWDSDDFYFLFDFIKEKYINNGYRVTDAIKEFKSGQRCHQETESYVLIDSITHHLIKLRVVSGHGKNTQIIGWGYPTDDHSSRENQPLFFKMIKQIFEKSYYIKRN
tara:strand:- start:19518 stop:20105 length:588 start_codon:yes stop_codon:yes gene_type:complete